jgi:benzoyl-CoA-dihydrodiol lyase
MDVQEDAGLSPDYKLKLNSYDLGVDIELADAIQRIRFEHPEVHAVVITSLKERVFCAGANIFMLRGSSHAWKVNFCKFTNETRLAIEGRERALGDQVPRGAERDLRRRRLRTGARVRRDPARRRRQFRREPAGDAAARRAAGTGGLTRVVDKRKVRRDLADVFGTVAEGVKGKRAVEWRLVDAVYPTSQFKQRVSARAQELAAKSDRPESGPGVALTPLEPTVTDTSLTYSAVSLEIDREKRVATLTVMVPRGASQTPRTPSRPSAIGFWPLRAFRELDDVLLRLRLNEPLIGTVVVKTRGDQDAMLAMDELLLANQDHWFVREIIHFMKRR